MNTKTRTVMSGYVSFPLTVDTRAVIFGSSGYRSTSPIVNILRVEKDCIEFETQNTIYTVNKPMPAPVMNELFTVKVPA
jgi:hypothetical protein